MKPALLLLLTLVICSPNLRAEIDYPITPESIQDQIALRSIAAVHDELFSHPYAINMLLLAIDSAEPDWLAVAKLLLQEQDPISGPRLIMAIGEGLQWEPASVLQRGFPLNKVCSLEGLYEWRRFSRFLVKIAIQRRISALEKLPQSHENAQKCLRLLATAKSEIATSLSNSLPEHSH